MYFQVHIIQTPTTFVIDANFFIDKEKQSLVWSVKLHKWVVFSEAKITINWRILENEATISKTSNGNIVKSSSSAHLRSNWMSGLTKLVIFAAFKKNNANRKLYTCVGLKNILCYIKSHHALEMVLTWYSSYALTISKELKGNYKKFQVWPKTFAHIYLFSL